MNYLPYSYEILFFLTKQYRYGSNRLLELYEILSIKTYQFSNIYCGKAKTSTLTGNIIECKLVYQQGRHMR